MELHLLQDLNFIGKPRDLVLVCCYRRRHQLPVVSNDMRTVISPCAIPEK